MVKGNKSKEKNVIQGIPIDKGGVILEPGSTKHYKTGEWRTFKPVIDTTKCIKCNKCWLVCPDAAVGPRKSDGKSEVNYDYCKGCLMCEKICPVKCITHIIEEK